nr:hypothetical protein [Pseudonocardia alni]
MFAQARTSPAHPAFSAQVIVSILAAVILLLAAATVLVLLRGLPAGAAE